MSDPTTLDNVTEDEAQLPETTDDVSDDRKVEERADESLIFTEMQHLQTRSTDLDLEQLRLVACLLAQVLITLFAFPVLSTRQQTRHTSIHFHVSFCRESLQTSLSSWSDAPEAEVSFEQAQAAWQQYDALTSSLSQSLCEQLRLVLEPTQASKLKYVMMTSQ